MLGARSDPDGLQRVHDDVARAAAAARAGSRGSAPTPRSHNPEATPAGPGRPRDRPRPPRLTARARRAPRPYTLASLAGVEHDGEGQRDATVEGPRGVGREVEDVAVEQ